MFLDKDELNKAIVSLAVEKVLLDIGIPVYEKVLKQLSKDYNCYLPDCYQHPEYLNLVLKKIFGNAYLAITDAIKQELNESMMERPIEIFVSSVCE